MVEPVSAVELDDRIADVEPEVVAVETLARQRLINVGKSPDEVVEVIVIGLDLPRETSLANLWNVGDAVREYANGGVQACAESAKLVVDEILKRVPVQ